MSDPADLLIVGGRVFRAFRPGEAPPLGSGYAAFADGRRGTLRPGGDGDLVVLDRDMLAEGPISITGTRVALTVVGGQVVHRTEGSR